MTIDAVPLVFLKVARPGEDAERLDVSDRVISFTYTDTERGADKFELTIDNNDLFQFDDPVFIRGNTIEVTWGYPGNFAPTREAVIRKVTGSRQITIVAHDKSVLMNTKARTELWESTKISEVAKAIAARNGYGSDKQYVQDTGIVLESLQQARLTDAQFLQRLARRVGFEWFIDFDGFHFHERVLDQPPTRLLRFYTDGSGEILDFNVDNDVTRKPGRVKVRAIDPITKEEVEGVGDNEQTERDGLAEIVHIFDPETAETHRQELGSEDVRPMVVQPDTAEQEVKQEADRRYKRGSQVAVKLSLELRGDPNLLAKSVSRVEGIAKRLSQRYYVREVQHKIANGYRMSAKCISDGDRGAKRVSDLLFEDKRKKTAAEPASESEQGEGNEAEPCEPDELSVEHVFDPESGATTRRQYVQRRCRGIGRKVANEKAATA